MNHDDVSLRDGVERLPSGIRGLDELLGGGLPAGRATIVSGTAAPVFSLGTYDPKWMSVRSRNPLSTRTIWRGLVSGR